jgi:hypothetical protein
MSGSTGPNLPVRIEVQGTQLAEAQFNAVGQAGQRAMQGVQGATDRAAGSAGTLRNAVGQAGFQVQDFAVQVQGGTSALTALAQQGSQFLGIFGPAGAMAGAALVVGILAVQLSGLGQSGETAADAMKRLGDEMEAAMRQAAELDEFVTRVNERFLSVPEAARLRQLRGVSSDIARTESELQGRVFAAANLARQIEGVDAEIAAVPQTFRQPDGVMDTAGGFGGLDPARQSAAADALRVRRDRLQQELRDFQGEALRFERDLERLRGLQLGIIADGSNATPGTLREDPAGRTPREPREPRDTVQNEIDRLIRDTETAAQRYERRIGEIVNLAEAARLRGNPIPQENIDRAVEAALADFDRLEQGTKRIGEESNRAGGFAQQLGLSFSSAFEDAIVKGRGLSDVLKGLEQDIARIIIRSAVTQPLANAVGGAIGPLGTSIGNFFADPTLGGKTGGSISVSATGARATGGPVFPGGTYLVGERGPELLTMGAAGHVTPNAGGPSISQTFNIDARGADASMVPRLRAEMVAVARAANAELLAEIQRGGRAASIVGRR